MISFACPACRKSLSVKDQPAGAKATCPACGRVVAIPGALEDRATLPPVPDQNGPSSGRDNGSAAGRTLDTPTIYHDARFTEFLAPRQSDDELGRLGKYRILSILGHGGMGVVFKAEDPLLGRLVALKVMLPEMAHKPGMKERFLREAKSAAAVQHDHIIAIHEVNEERGVPFIAMPFLEGASLEDWLCQGRTPTARQILKLGREIARGLGAAHTRGLIHRDVKPGNIWLDASAGGRVKILDFGVARVAGEQNLTQTGAILGTPAYMAPEQARSEKVDGRADLFSLGVVLYRLCTGVMPFKGHDTMSTLMALAMDNPNPPHVVNPAVSRPLSDLVMALLEKNPAKRPGTADEVVRALQSLEKEPRQEEAEGVALATRAASERETESRKGSGGYIPPVPARGASGAASPGVPPLPRKQAAATSSKKHDASTEFVRRRPVPRQRRLVLVVTGLVLFAGLIGLAAWALLGGRNKESKQASNTNRPGNSLPDNKETGKPKDGKTANKTPPVESSKGWPREVENSVGMTLVRIPPGTFTMGSSKKEEGRDNFGEDQHEVEITKEFWLGIHEVTQMQFETVMGYNPSFFSKAGKGKPGVGYPSPPAGGKDRVPADTGDFPVESVSWDEADEFCKKLTARIAEKKSGRVYRLPTEAEWEYSCRGGAPSYQVFHFGNSLPSTQANIFGSLGRTCKVGTYEKNRFGLYDLHGNVWEWCADWYGKDYYAKSPRRDPSGASEGSDRVVRGGSWSRDGSDCRSANRYGYEPAYRGNFLGFRVALVPSSR
jgi:formylglycine-generating enzyme required for sulfatase activity